MPQGGWIDSDIMEGDAERGPLSSEVPEASMPSHEEVTERARGLWTMMALTLQEFSTLLPHFKHALLSSIAAHMKDGNPVQSAAIARMLLLLYPRWPTNCSSC
jgi:hypothetical protein